jgi:histone arginine demethylase JMJD6
MGWRRRMQRARRLHRPSLKNWEADKLYFSFPAFALELENTDNYRSFFLENEEENRPVQQRQSIPVVLDAATLTPEAFYEYERKGIPAVIRNIPAGYDGGKEADPWHAVESWKLETLEDNDKLLKRRFKCGEDDDGKNIKIKLKTFLKYTRHNRDDSPLYVFDSAFDEDRGADQILKDYRVPTYFSDDLFSLVSESRRPPYRWFLVGPERSGTCVHIDPLATSAWNTLVTGQKRWVVFPPYVAREIVKGKGLVREDEDDEAIHYFMFILPRIKRQAQSLKSSPQYKDFCCYEFTQNAGETVFIPNGWWHAVLNLTDTTAITQNFCSPRNFDAVWLQTRTGRKRMAWKWLLQLEQKYPALAARAKAMNQRDQFVMKYDPVEMERRERVERVERERKAEKKLRRFHDGGGGLTKPVWELKHKTNGTHPPPARVESHPTVSPEA